MKHSSFYGSLVAVTAWTGLSLLLGGCSVANRAIRSDFTEFNTTLQFNQTQQMLLNVVRMHFRESPMFLQAGSLTAAYESRVGANVGLNREQLVLSGSETEFDYAFSTKPTVSYSTVEGKNYVQQLLTEISPQTFCLLLRAGWPVEPLASLLIERVTLPGGAVLVNHAEAPSAAKFQEFVAKLKAAQTQYQLTVVAAPTGYALIIGEEEFPLQACQFRSLFDVMFAASHNTPTPPGQERRARNSAANGKLKIRVSDSRLRDSMVWVRHNGHFYSISHDDIESKDTLALLMQLYRIQAAPPAEAPLLTIPVR
jgi:hypothetical protein